MNVVAFEPLRDKTYRQTRLGRSVVDFLAWCEVAGLAERTLDQYERDLARGALMFPDVGVDEFDHTLLFQVAASFQEAERRVRVAAWKSFFRWAVLMGLIEVNPAARLPRIQRTPQRVVDTFSEEEIVALGNLPLRDGALMDLLFDEGFRKGEARRFRLVHYRLDEIVILRGKGGKDRVLPATEHVIRRINELALVEGLKPQDHLWYSRPGGGNKVERSRPIGEGSFHRWWSRCLDQAGVAYRNPHVARHTFATRYLRRGGRLDLLSLAMGHASIKTTFDLYGHLDMRDLSAEFAMLFPSGETV